jgi:hypothetical protein
MNTLSGTLKSAVERTVINFTCAYSSDDILKASFFLGAIKGVTTGLFIANSDCMGMALTVSVINTLYCITFQNG